MKYTAQIWLWRNAYILYYIICNMSTYNCITFCPPPRRAVDWWILHNSDLFYIFLSLPGNAQPFGSFNQRPPTFGNTSVAAGSERNQTVWGGVKQFGNRKPLFGNGGKMYGERENVNPFSNHFGEEKPFQNRQMREEVS